ncbi:MAG: rRNA pseudouridine synthase [Candidatus Hydrogenedentes bacterium]|nr:rRNA pseudouridine synthase [Candidatus Hydrogenedentota bacterium]
MIRLQKFMAACGVASRRACEDLIAAGRVRVNGEPSSVGDTVDPERDEILLDGHPLRQDTLTYILLNKPRGVVTTLTDPHGRPTVVSCLAGLEVRVFPVGRLDLDVEGALLLTNDGELAHRLMHPRYGVDKAYLARVKGLVASDTATRLRTGVELDDGMTAPAGVEIVKRDRDATELRLVLREGRKREVKRMCDAVGHPVQELRRVAFAGLDVRGLAPGAWRRLRASEVRRLRDLAGMSDTA